MDYAEFLRKIPKVELHCHLEGSVRATTAVELAKKYSVRLPTYEPEELYQYEGIVEFLERYIQISHAIIDREDFARIAYEALADGVAFGNLRYREMFLNPTNHYADGVSYDTVIDGAIDGIRQAERDYGVQCRLIVGINRAESPSDAVTLVQQVVDSPRDEVVGIGQDHLTPDNEENPGRFTEAYRLAVANGLNITAHAGEIDSSTSADVAAALDLGCLRIDHGYKILEDSELLKRARDNNVYFTCCLFSSRILSGWHDLANHPIRHMIDAGLNVTLNTDDPTMMNTHIGKEYEEGCVEMGLGLDQVIKIVFNGVDAAWMNGADKQALRHEFEEAINSLGSELN
ncbi:MAG: adenosine deaminase [Acidimicrobiales bacterium]|nr:adenosine deaminase [Acidimicrobiales bacterium]